MSLEHEQTVRLLTRTVVHCGEVLARTNHAHLIRTLREALEALMRSAFTDAEDRTTICADAKQLRACLEDISIVSGAPLASLLLAERHVLLLELHLTTPRVHAPQVTRGSHKSTPKANLTAPIPLSGSTRDSLEQVLAFVRSNGPVQARDIIAGCGPKLSERTVKRRVSDLVQMGHLIKEERDGVLLYSIFS